MAKNKDTKKYNVSINITNKFILFSYYNLKQNKITAELLLERKEDLFNDDKVYRLLRNHLPQWQAKYIITKTKQKIK